MAQIVYAGEDGKVVAIKNPTSADYDEMWGVIAKRIAPDFIAAFNKEMKGSLLYETIRHPN